MCRTFDMFLASYRCAMHGLNLTASQMAMHCARGEKCTKHNGDGDRIRGSAAQEEVVLKQQPIARELPVRIANH